MLDLFVGALMTVTVNMMELTPEKPKKVVSSQLRATGAGNRYDGTYTACQDVQNSNSNSANNDFSPLMGIPAQNGVPINNLNPKITALEAPKHGIIKVTDAAWYMYTFIPDKNYLGKDRVVYEIEAQGKRYKVTLNFWIMSVVVDPKGDAPYVPDCLYQKFNGSFLNPNFLFEPSGCAITSYMAGALPVRSGSIGVVFSDPEGDAVGETTVAGHG